MKRIWLQNGYFLFFSFCALLSYGQTTAKTKAYQAGFKIIRTVDTSRVFKPNSNTTDYLHYRPLDFDIWYPAKTSSTDSNLMFKDFLSLLEKRANYYTASTAGNGITGQVAQSFCDFFKCSDTSKLLRFKTNSYRDATPVEGRFPLVVYFDSYNSMCYENIKVFEDLARKGFVVVSINSIGRYPGDMTMKKQDMMEQVKDAVYAINLLSKDEHVDSSKIGIVGYSWGGVSSAMLANSVSNTACLVSLDGSEFHHYGEAKQENEDFEGITNSKEFKSMHLYIPYLRLESAPEGKNKKDSVYNFTQKLSNQKVILVVDSANHQDFSYLPTVARTSGNCKNNNIYNTITKLTESFLEEHLMSKNEFQRALRDELNRTVRKK
jgi:hypothetical protein